MKKIMFLLVFFLSGCGNTIKQGKVAAKTYHPAYTSYVMSGKVLVPIRHSERHSLLILEGEKSETFYIDKSVFESCNVGNTYNAETKICN